MILLRSHLWSGSEDTVTLSPPFLLWRGEVGHGNGQHASFNNYDLLLRVPGLCAQDARSNSIDEHSLNGLVSHILLFLAVLVYAKIDIVTRLSRVQRRLLELDCSPLTVLVELSRN